MTVEHQADLRRFVDGMPAPVAMLDAQGRLVACSSRWASTFEIPDEPDTAPHFFNLFVEGEPWASALEGGVHDQAEAAGEEALLARHGGPHVNVAWEMRPWRAGGSGETQSHGVLLYVTDATPRATSLYDTLADTVEAGVLLMDRSGVFQSCNGRAAEILGRAPHDVIGSAFSDKSWKGLREDGTPLPNESFPFWVARYTGEPVRGEVMGIYPAEGPPRWVRVSAQPLYHEGTDEPYAVLTVFVDITQQRLSEEALRTSKGLLASVLASSLDGIMVFSSVRDDAGDIVDFEWLLVNPQAEKLVNRSAEELTGKRLLEEMPGNAATGLFDDYVEVVETGEPLQREIYYEHEGISAWFQVIAVKLNDGFAVTFRDITERKEATQAMRTANRELEARNQALREFAYIASHDLQEPLRKITAFADLMREDYGEAVDETGDYYLERMQDAARRMSTLISDLLDYSRVTTRSKPFEETDLNDLIDEVRADLDLRIRDVKGRIEVGDLPTLVADPTQIRQLLQNLIGNALKFHKPDEPPVVRVSGDVIVEAGSEADQHGRCRLKIEDNGIGMEEKYLERIFSPFKRLHGRSQFEGTGMGLAICRRIVERHGGDISVSSTPGEGTCFTIELPLEQPDTDDRRVDLVFTDTPSADE